MVAHITPLARHRRLMRSERNRSLFGVRLALFCVAALVGIGALTLLGWAVA